MIKVADGVYQHRLHRSVAWHAGRYSLRAVDGQKSRLTFQVLPKMQEAAKASADPGQITQESAVLEEVIDCNVDGLPSWGIHGGVGRAHVTVPVEERPAAGRAGDSLLLRVVRAMPPNGRHEVLRFSIERPAADTGAEAPEMHPKTSAATAVVYSVRSGRCVSVPRLHRDLSRRAGDGPGRLGGHALPGRRHDLVHCRKGGCIPTFVLYAA